MRDSQPKSELHKYSSGGKDPNYLVRSWASSLGTVTQGHKVPKSDYRSQWLQRLNRVELMQNVEVQQALRNMMSILKVGDELMQDAESAYEFAEKRRIQKCHQTVCKIRAESQLSKMSSNLPTKGQDDLEMKATHERHIVRRNSKHKINLPVSSLEDNTKTNAKFTNNTKISSHDDLDNIYEMFTQKGAENSHINNNKLYISQAENQQGERKEFLPPIPEASQEKQCITYHREKKKHKGHSLPTLDTESKFSIIKRTRELRNEHDMQVNNQPLSSMTSQLQRKYSKARKISRKIEIFGDNSKLLVNEESKFVDKKQSTALPLLDTKSFSEIDCNDFLNVKNRLDGLSPAPAVLDHKLHWPTRRTKDTL